jgi:hypothetical protein
LDFNIFHPPEISALIIIQAGLCPPIGAYRVSGQAFSKNEKNRE